MASLHYLTHVHYLQGTRKTRLCLTVYVECTVYLVVGLWCTIDGPLKLLGQLIKTDSSVPISTILKYLENVK